MLQRRFFGWAVMISAGALAGNGSQREVAAEDQNFWPKKLAIKSKLRVKPINGLIVVLEVVAGEEGVNT